MSGWKSWKKRARHQARAGWKEARGRLDRLARETAPERELLAREARRRTPAILALLAATAREMMRNYPSEPPRPKSRGLRVWKLLLVAVAAVGIYSWLRGRED